MSQKSPDLNRKKCSLGACFTYPYRFLKRLLSLALLALVKLYQVCISPLKPACCIYTPTCSQYAIEAIQKYGPFKGSWLAIKRICRCHPWHEGGYDPVP